MALGVDAIEVHGVRVLVLGPLAVEHDGQELHVAGSQRRRLLALLASHAARPASADAIADVLWGEDLPPTSTKAIQNHVARLRRSFAAIDGELIATTSSGYRLAVAPEAIDAVAFEQLAGRGPAAARGRRRGRCGGRARRGARALAGAGVRRTSAMPASPPARRPGSTSSDGPPARTSPRHGSKRQASIWPIADLERLVREQPGASAAGPADPWPVRRGSPARRPRGIPARPSGVGRGVRPRARRRAPRPRAPGARPGPRARPSDGPPALPATLRRHAGPLFGRARNERGSSRRWHAARAGSGQMRLLLGPVDSGRTRLVAELAAMARRRRWHTSCICEARRTSAARPGGFVDAITDQQPERAGPRRRRRRRVGVGIHVDRAVGAHRRDLPGARTPSPSWPIRRRRRRAPRRCAGSTNGSGESLTIAPMPDRRRYAAAGPADGVGTRRRSVPWSPSPGACLAWPDGRRRRGRSGRPASGS